MQFENEIEADLPPYNPAISVSFEVTEEPSNIIQNSGLTATQLKIECEFNGDQVPDSLLIETSTRGTISPSEHEIGASTRSLSCTIYCEPDATPSLRIFLKQRSSWDGPLEFKLPSYNSCESAHNLVFGRPSEKSLSNISELHGLSEYSEAIFSLLSEVNKWVTADIHYQILNISSKLSPEVNRAINRNSIVGFLSNELAGEGNFNIESRERVEQLATTISELSNLPNVTAYDIFGGGLSQIDSAKNPDMLWRFEEKYEIAQDNWESILRNDQMAALLGRAIVEREVETAKNIIESWIGPSEEVDNISNHYDEAREADGVTALEKWKTALRFAVEEPPSELEYAGANFLYKFHQTRSGDIDCIYTDMEVCRCGFILFDEQNITEPMLYMKSRYYAASGQFYRRQENFDSAENAYEKYLSVSLEGIKNDVIGVTQYWPIYWLYRSRADSLRHSEKFETATEALEKGQDLLRALEDIPESTQTDLVSQLNAVRHEIQGDSELSHNNLNSASRHYGQAISIYLDQGMERAVRYLKQRRKLIEASLAEQEGDFVAAEEAHNEIVRITRDPGFEDFNRARSKISKAKHHISEFNIDNALRALPTRLGNSNVARAEAKHLELLLEVLENYNNGNIQDVRNVLDDIQSLPDIGVASEPFPFEYGHDYRPAFVNSLAAQRLKRFEIDTILIDELLEISIMEVLAPDSVESQITRSGISTLNLRTEWKQYFPLHIVRRYQETREKEISAVDNYVDEGLALLRIVEQSLEFCADYYVQKEVGSDWMSEFSEDGSDRLNLSSLRDILNTEMMERLVWCDEVRELIDEPLIGEDNLIEARNALGHDRRSRISDSQYQKIRERVEIILARISTEVPILVSGAGSTPFGLSELRAHWENPRKMIRVQTEEDLRIGKKYYIPFESDALEPVMEIDQTLILPVQSQRVIDNIDEYN